MNVNGRFYTVGEIFFLGKLSREYWIASISRTYWTSMGSLISTVFGGKHMVLLHAW